MSVESVEAALSTVESNADSVPTVNVAETPDDNVQAQEILARAQGLIDQLPDTHDAVQAQNIRNQLVGVRAELFALVLKRYGGDEGLAVNSPDFDQDFKVMTEAIQPPDRGSSRPFPGTRRLGTGENGRRFVGDR